MPTRCFLVVPADRAAKRLRRFTWSRDSDGRPPCVAGWRFHDANSEPVGETTRLRRHPTEGWLLGGWPGRAPARSDPRWPAECSRGCGYRFADSDEWMARWDLLWRRTDSGELARLEDHGAGSMYDAPWQPAAWRGTDGLALNVMLPCGHPWAIDGPATSGGHWTRSGTPPDISANPSILCGIEPTYHGWLGVNGQPPGWLSDHIG